MEGFFKVPRDIIESDEYLSEKFSRGQALIDLINLSLYREKKYRIRGIEVVGNPGEVHCSSQYLAERWQWSRGKVMRFLDELEEKRYIEQQKTPVIKVLRLLFLDGHSTTERTLNRTTNRTPNSTVNSATNSTTLEEGKKERRKEGENTIREREAPTPDFLSNFDKSDLGKPEAPAVNMQADQGGQKKKSSAQKRKGTEPVITEQDYVAFARPETITPRTPGYLQLVEALAAFYREKKGEKTKRSAQGVRHELRHTDLRTAIWSLQKAANERWQGYHERKPPDLFMTELKPQKQAAAAKLTGTMSAMVGQSERSIIIEIKEAIMEGDKDAETYARAALYCFRANGKPGEPAEIYEVKKRYQAGEIELDNLVLD